MEGDHAPRRGEARSAQATVARRQVSSRRDAALVGLWAALFAVFTVAGLRVGLDLWAVSRGATVIVVLVGLGLVSRIGSARTRTVRPRRYNLVEGAAAVWAGAGVGFTGMMLGIPNGHDVSMRTALLASLVLSAPLFGCAAWLAVQGR